MIEDNTEVIVIGAGAAGLMCAIEAAKRGRQVYVVEKSNKVAEKIRISGGGRCNFTNLNTHPACYLSHNPHFCKSALARYTPWHFIEFISTYGLSWHEKAAKNQFGYQSSASAGQLFCDQKSQGIIDALLQACKDNGVRLLMNSEVETIEKKPDGFSLHFKNLGAYQNRVLGCESLVIATGGPSIPKLGASDFASDVAKRFGMNVYSFEPALVPLCIDNAESAFLKGLSGVSVWAEMTASHADYGQGRFKENLLITHRGLSGPVTLQVSSFWQAGEPIEIDWLPELDVINCLLDLKATSPNSKLSSALKKHLADKFVLAFMASRGLPDQPLQIFNKKQLEMIALDLQHFKVTPSATEGFAKAEVSRGGVDTNELSSKTMQSKKVSGLYFVGEAIDVTGFLGGYNFQWAWASGWCAGQVA